MSQALDDFFEAMKEEAATMSDQLMNQGGGLWEKLYVGDDPYSSYTNTADEHFDREESLEDYRNAAGEDGRAAKAIRAKLEASFLGSGIAGLSQRRLGRLRSFAAALSRRAAMAEGDLDKLHLVAFGKWDGANAGNGYVIS